MCSVGCSLFNCVSVGWWSHGFMCSVWFHSRYRDRVEILGAHK